MEHVSVRARPPRFARIPAILLCALAVLPASASAQAVYGSIGGIVKDPSGAILPGVTINITSIGRQTTDSVVTNESGLFVKERLLPGEYRVEGRTDRVQDGGSSACRSGRRSPDAGRVHAGGRPGHRRSHRHRRRDVTDDGSRRRVHAVRGAADHRSAGARPQLHEVSVADARHAAAAMAARGEREPAGLDADDGQRPTLQRHELPARWHRQQGSDPGDYRDQSDARVGGRDQDHLAELRRGVRPRGCRRRLGADPVRHQHLSRQRLRVLPERQIPVAQPVHAVPAGSDHRPPAAGDQPASVRRIGRRTAGAKPLVLLRRLPGHARDAGRLAAALGADRRGAQRRSERLRRSISTIPRPDSSSRTTSFRRGGSQRRRRRCWS